LARTYSFGESDTFEPWALAEGVVEYHFTRNWPQEGIWMIRYVLGSSARARHGRDSARTARSGTTSSIRTATDRKSATRP
jgi:hypothetical protein